MDRFDGQLPEDVREIAARLSAARETPSPLELDELSRRVGRRAARERRPRRTRVTSRLRSHAVASLAALGLIAASGAAAVVASADLGGNYSQTWSDTSFHGIDSASWCQYHHAWSQSYTYKDKHSIVTLSLVWDCHFLHIHITCNQHFKWQLGNGQWNDVEETSYDTKTSPGAPYLHISVGGSTFTAPFSW